MIIQPLIVCLFSYAVVAGGVLYLRNGWAAILLYHVVLITALIFRKNPRFDIRQVFRGFSVRCSLVMIVSYGTLALAIYYALSSLDPSGVHIARRFAKVGLTPATIIPFTIYTCFVNPVLEELYWRGNYADSGRASYLNDLYYSLFHLPIYLAHSTPRVIVMNLVCVAVLGLIWRIIARRLNGLAVPVIGHVVLDLGVGLAIIAIITR